MSCPTCGHTMQSLSTGERHYWCPRCGTLKEVGTHYDDVDVPKLFVQCRAFAATFPPGNPPSVSYSAEWHRLGIAESINVPEVTT